MKFDFHTHFFPDKLKGKVYPKLSVIANCDYYRDETLEQTLIQNEKDGITHFLGLHIATNPLQQSSVNDFAIASQSENMYSFGSVHPKAEGSLEEISRLKENGIKGIKLHPDYQEFFSNDDCMTRIYELCDKLGMIVAFHTGFDPYSPKIIHNTPKMLSEVAKSFENLKIVALHMGGMKMKDEAIEYLSDLENVYFDTAIASQFLSVQEFKEIVDAKGADKILFGTDSPWSTGEIEAKLIEDIGLTKEQKELIYYKNAFNLLGIV